MRCYSRETLTVPSNMPAQIAAPTLMLAIVALQGCAINGMGLVVGWQMDSDQARVTLIRQFGGHLRTWPGVEGLTVGYSQLQLLYPPAAEPPSAAQARATPSQWKFGYVPTTSEPLAAVVLQATGIDLSFGQGRVSFTLGHRQYVLLAAISPDQSLWMEIVYNANAPDLARVSRQSPTVPFASFSRSSSHN